MNVVRDTLSPANAKTGADREKSNSEMNTEILYVEENMVGSYHNTLEAYNWGARHIENPHKLIRDSCINENFDDAIYLASSSVPLLSTPIIDLTSPKPVSPPAQEPIFTATTTTTTTTLPLPPPP
ncbi:hypothetical protein Tco_0450278 [Tanacetum coccineum]